MLFIRAMICNFKLNMEFFFENENTCDIFMNEIIMEDGPLQELGENASVLTKGSENPKKMKKNEIKLRKLHAQRLFWKPHSKNALCWAFFYVNDNKEVDLIVLEIMHYIF
jgi:hypothetical protein